MQFIGAIDEEGKKTELAGETFSKHDDDEFAAAFEKMVQEGYSDVFELHGDDTWKLDKDALITFFRTADQTSAAIGGRQANLFLAFAALSGHGEVVPAKKPNNSNSTKTTTKASKPKPVKKDKSSSSPQPVASGNVPSAVPDFGLSVKIEVNLPANADAETYDSIFRSIKKHLMSK